MEKESIKNQVDEDDFENCKGACGYTIWCKACKESRKEEENRRAEESVNSDQEKNDIK